MLARKLEELVVDSLDDWPTERSISVDRGLRCRNKLCVPNLHELKKEIMDEAHRSRYTIHPEGTKMYRDLKRSFWWEGMNREISEYVPRCFTCQQVKVKHQRPSGLLQPPLDIPSWKWDHISLDFVDGLPRSLRDNESI